MNRVAWNLNEWHYIYMSLRILILNFPSMFTHDISLWNRIILINSNLKVLLLCRHLLDRALVEQWLSEDTWSIVFASHAACHDFCQLDELKLIYMSSHFWWVIFGPYFKTQFILTPKIRLESIQVTFFSLHDGSYWRPISEIVIVSKRSMMSCKKKKVCLDSNVIQNTYTQQSG